jgi:glyoxylase-like metal-dependent hydrolase (beta-lactamase superfamily II)/rhodanese-related sulfurtransferase
MYIKQIYTSCLAQASYYVESKGCVTIVDPIRDVDVYLQLAKERNAKIQYVLETHFHADFVSGHLELERKTGAVIIFGPGAHPNYKAMVAKDGDVIYLGDIKIKLIHTPGHTVESACFLVYNEQDLPYALFTGDTLFVGDVGRPDLGSGNLSREELASMLYDSLNLKLKTLPDEVIVFPGHGAGSACGKNIGKETWSTLGEQKKMNYALQDLSREEFIRKVTSNLSVPPPYFSHDASANQLGYGVLEDVIRKGTIPLSADEFRSEMKKGSIVLDVRNSTEFGIGFIKGSLNIGLDGAFAIWAGNLIPSDKSIVLVVRDHQKEEAVKRLARIGFDKVHGYLKDDLIGWINVHYPVDHVQTISEVQVEQCIQNGYIPLDVRTEGEVVSNRIRNALHIPLNLLQNQLTKLDTSRKYLVYCAGGYRSMIAASILKAKGFNQIVNVRGGITQVKKDTPLLIENIA